MSQTAKTVAKQASFLMAASSLQKLISFAAFTFAARRLGTDGVGAYFYVLSVSSLAAAWTDLGLTPVVIRAFAASAEEGWRLVAAAVRAKALLIPLAAVGALAYWTFGNASGAVPWAFLAIALVVMAEDAVSLLGYGVLRGQQRLDIESVGTVLGQLLSSGALIVAVALGWGVAGALAALAIASLWHVAWSLAWVFRLRRPPSGLSPYPWSSLARLALPFALAGIFVRIYSFVDALLLKHWHGVGAVGQYAVAYKMTYALQFLPLAFVAALYPALSAAHAREDEQALVHTALGSWRFMAVLGFPLAAALSGFAPRLLPLLYGERFLAAAPILAVLAWVLPLIFLDFPVGSYLNATQRAVQKTTAMGLTMLVNAGLNLAFVPLWGGQGAAWAAVGGFVVLLGVGAWYGRRIFLSRTALVVAAQGAALGLALWAFIRIGLVRLPLPAALVLAPLAALVGAWGVRLVRQDDLALLLGWIRRRAA